MTAKILGVIGDPIEHSLSPVMHQAAIAALGLDLEYHACHVRAGELPDFVEKMRAGEFLGINVTLPHKESVAAYLDELSQEVQNIMAVNTVVVANNKLIGHNTDALGYIESLRACGFDPMAKTALILGAGGAARAVLVGLAEAGLKAAVIANRTLDKAQQLMHALQQILPTTQWQAMSLDDVRLASLIPQQNLIVNATSLGLKGRGIPPLAWHEVRDQTLFSDIVYNPLVTPFLAQAKRLGRKTHVGLGMFVNQGARSFELWTGIKPDRNIMKEAVLKALR